MVVDTYYHHDDKRKLFTMQFNIMYPNPPLQCCLPSNIMYKSAINNIEWGKGVGIVAAFFNFPFVFQWTWKHIFCSGCLNLSHFFWLLHWVCFLLSDCWLGQWRHSSALCSLRQGTSLINESLKAWSWGNKNNISNNVILEEFMCGGVAWMKTCT